MIKAAGPHSRPYGGHVGEDSGQVADVVQHDDVGRCGSMIASRRASRSPTTPEVQPAAGRSGAVRVAITQRLLQPQIGQGELDGLADRHRQGAQFPKLPGLERPRSTDVQQAQGRAAHVQGYTHIAQRWLRGEVSAIGFFARKWGQCGLAMSRSLVGGNPTWVIVSREPSIEPCGAHGNGRVDA